MKKEHIKDIFKKYENGQTSLEEEQFLLKNATGLDFPLSDWINLEKKRKKEVSEDFNERLWQSFDQRTQPKKKILKSALIAAASVVLFFTFYSKNKQESTQQSLWEKEALLLEAKSMFSENEQNINQEIVFEDDLITIYMATK
ncbi:hypothetical protein [Winogradskyella flava]|uniref:hypothetical protein n=1 Tax=Winogradskyella flava TaxID=1884876 RepID=UPI002491CE0F|nr:hypothetical protein [Winogradskyella flava]